MTSNVQQFKVTLDRKIYFPGMPVKGTLTLQLRQDIQCRGVRVHLQGKGHSKVMKNKANS
jgi:hypothetical protein